jgi:hypothetical protein
MKRITQILPLIVFLVFPSAFSASGPKVLNTELAGSVPNVMVRSVNSGGAPWVVKTGKVKLDADGYLVVRGKGLLIGDGALANGAPVPANLIGTVATVTMVHAALTCGGPGGGVPFTITSTEAVPLSPEGDFEINADLAVPSVCSQPIILIRGGTPASPGAYIAASPLTLTN